MRNRKIFCYSIEYDGIFIDCTKTQKDAVSVAFYADEYRLGPLKAKITILYEDGSIQNLPINKYACRHGKRWVWDLSKIQLKAEE